MKSVFLSLLMFVMIQFCIADEQPQGVPVVFEGKTLFTIYAPLGTLSVQERSEAVSRRLQNVQMKKHTSLVQLKVIASEITVDIVYDTTVLLSVTVEDARYYGKSQNDTAEDYRAILEKEVFKVGTYVIVNEPKDIVSFITAHKYTLIHILVAIVGFIALGMLLFFINKLLGILIKKVKELSPKDIMFRSKVVFRSVTVKYFLTLMLKLLALMITITLLYTFVLLVYDLFDWNMQEWVKELIQGVLLTVFTIIVWMGLYRLLGLFFTLMQRNLIKAKGILFKGLVINGVTLLSESQMVKAGVVALKILRFFCNLFLLYIFIPIVFSYFNFSKTWADALFRIIATPLSYIIRVAIGYFPNLLFIVIVVFVCKYVLKLIRMFFNEIKSNAIAIKGFHEEWAEPTYKIIRFGVVVFAIILIYPYLPGAKSDAFKGISLFFGILFSLGSTSIVANAVAGIILTYMYSFNKGDRVKIGEITGDVLEKTLLVTRLNTLKNEVVSIPNAVVMSHHVTNYSSKLAQEPLILHTAVTLGYDIPWRDVHEALITAALRCTAILKNPDPFVLQKSLDDYYVSYEINAYTDQPHSMSSIYSELHQSIQDVCKERGIEILSPAYSSLRDGNDSTIPGYVPQKKNGESFFRCMHFFKEKDRNAMPKENNDTMNR